jgi:hypothetical protein
MRLNEQKLDDLVKRKVCNFDPPELAFKILDPKSNSLPVAPLPLSTTQILPVEAFVKDLSITRFKLININRMSA